ncbi:autophagy-related protein 22-1 [Trematosphaeria pertusa]|uniref:Autophagy-related protein n=1 Tax=Trematosphaeria pertusa TaxID=390896 RepID=A0A6A6IK62_9PLEO|nr:autophagy-related protein 22-1 [Trematosphaeria pertusa]KAF2250766.1 autophagy-related protein 22-1 [Trematosphaeria pertusa]
MSFDEAVRPRQRTRYKGEDTSPTTPRELNGWYSYAIAAEVFAVVGVGLFLPVVLEQLSRENGVFFSDRSKPCVTPPGSADSGRLRVRAGDGREEQCIVKFLGAEITTASFAMYTSSAAVLVQAVTLVCFSSFADHGPYRKKMLLAFAYAGSIVSALFIFITPGVYFLAPFLVIIGVTCLGCSFTLLNAFLPLLVSNHIDNASRSEDRSSSDHELEALNPESTSTRRSDPEKLTRDLERSAKISSKGVGLGYAAAVFVQVFSIIVLFLFSKTSISTNNPSLPIRVILFLVGIWWASFTIPTLLWLRPRPGPPLPTQSKTPFSRRGNTFLFYTLFSLRSFWHTLKKALRLRQVIIFLIAWFLLSDAIATISGTAVLFARTELQMGTIAVALLSITSIGCGMFGAFIWPRAAAAYSLTPKTVLILCVAAMEVIPLYGLLGYIPFVKALGFGGLQKPWEIYPLGVVHGLVMGGISSYARSVYAPLIPEGSEAAFFALYAVTDKGSSAFGPALVGWIVDRAGTIRPAFAFLAVLVLLPGPLLWRLDVEKGREDAGRMAAREREFVVGDGGEDEGNED